MATDQKFPPYLSPDPAKRPEQVKRMATALLLQMQSQKPENGTREERISQVLDASAGMVWSMLQKTFPEADDGMLQTMSYDIAGAMLYVAAGVQITVSDLTDPSDEPGSWQRPTPGGIL